MLRMAPAVPAKAYGETALSGPNEVGAGGGGRTRTRCEPNRILSSTDESGRADTSEPEAAPNGELGEGEETDSDRS